MHTLGYDLISATSATTIYIAVGTADNNQMGILKLDDYWYNNDVIEWYQKYDCTADATACFPSSVLESTTNADYLYMSSIVKTTKTYN